MKKILYLTLFALILDGSPRETPGQSPQNATKSRNTELERNLQRKKEEDKLCSWYRTNYRHISGTPGDHKVPLPEYPQEAKEAGITGSVIVAVRVNEKGIVELAAACKGPAILRPAAVLAAYKAVFSPVVYKRMAMTFLTALTFNFN